MLLEVNIKKWNGPDFQDRNGHPIPCTTANIRRLDPNEPLVQKVLKIVGDRNEPPNAQPSAGEPLDPNLLAPSISEE
jgi:hypothetical protein